MDQRQPLYNFLFSNAEHGSKTTRRITDRSIHNSYVYLNGVKIVLQNLLHYNYRIVKNYRVLHSTITNFVLFICRFDYCFNYSYCPNCTRENSIYRKGIVRRCWLIWVSIFNSVVFYWLCFNYRQCCHINPKDIKV